jgi:dolichol-phosphate mannosyltransferase
MIFKSDLSDGKYQIISEESVAEFSEYDGFKLSVVIPCFNEEETLLHSFNKIVNDLYIIKDIELVLVDDGSDDSTWEIILDIKSKDKRVKGIKLSRNFGHQYAVTAGLSACNGDCIAIIDADLQDPPGLILKMISLWKKGHYVIFGKRKKRDGESLFKIITANIFYKFLNFLSGDFIPRDTGDFRLIDKKINNTLKEMPEYDRFLRGMIAWVGFSQVGIEYNRDKREYGETKYTFKKMVSLAASAIFSFSLKPLRVAIVLGALSAGIAISIVFYSIVMKIFGSPVPGWTTLTVLISFFSGVQLISIGLLGEYVGRAFIQAKHRPQYIIEETTQEYE